MTETLQLVYAVLIGLSFGTFSIALKNNISVFSYLWLRGKCRYCSAAILGRMPIVGAGTAVQSAIAVARFDMSVEAAVILTSIGIIDLDTRLILMVLVGPGLVIALALFPFGPGSELGIGEAFFRTAVGALSGFTMLLVVYLVAQFMEREAGSAHCGSDGVPRHVRWCAIAWLRGRWSDLRLPDSGAQTIAQGRYTFFAVPGGGSHRHIAD